MNKEQPVDNNVNYGSNNNVNYGSNNNYVNSNNHIDNNDYINKSKEELIKTVNYQKSLLEMQANQIQDVIDISNAMSKKSAECNGFGIFDESYNDFIKSQIFLFTLFIIVLFWLLYHQFCEKH